MYKKYERECECELIYKYTSMNVNTKSRSQGFCSKWRHKCSPE